jgi:hypothetical protein
MRLFWTALLALSLQMAPLAALAAIPTPVKSAPFPMTTPMRIVLVRSAEPDCDPHCAQWLSAEGDLYPGVAADFGRALHALGNRKLPILINSRGGSVADALAIGRMIRAQRLDIAVAKTRFEACQPTDAACQKARDFDGFRGTPDAHLAICASACAYLFAGGVNRYVGYASYIGLHQSTSKRQQILTRYWVTTRRFADGSTQTTKTVTGRSLIDLGTAAQTSEQEYRTVANYLQEMGVAPKELLAIVVATPASTIHWMTPVELMTTNLTNLWTDRRDGEYLIGEIDKIAKEAYFASPEYRTFAYAYALLPMGMFDERQTSLALNFSHRKNTAKVDLTIVPTSDGAFLSTTPLKVDLGFPGDRTFAAVNVWPLEPRAPMTTHIPLAAFCDLSKDSIVKVSLEARSGSVPDSALYTDARQFLAMDQLLTEACRK